MFCRRARRDIALYIGDDLDDASKRRLKRHLAACPRCRAHYQQVKASLSPLYERDDSAPEPADDHDSIWPGMIIRLPAVEKQREAPRFNGWLPAMAVAASCLAIVVFARTDHFGGGARGADAAGLHSDTAGSSPGGSNVYGVGADFWGQPALLPEYERFRKLNGLIEFRDLYRGPVKEGSLNFPFPAPRREDESSRSAEPFPR